MHTFFPDTHPVMQTPAIWHPSPDCPRLGFAVVLFRRAFRLRQALRPTTVWVSASQRFELFLDGVRIARGPSRSDPGRWGVVAVRLPSLPKGRHVLAARVTQFGPHGGIGQMGGPGFFLLRTEAPAESAGLPFRQTDADWRCWHDRSRVGGVPAVWSKRRFTYVVGAGESLRAALTPWGWETLRFDDRAWPASRVVCAHAADPWGNLPLRHILEPDPLPQMEERVERFTRVAEATGGLADAAVRWIRGEGRVTVPARTTARLLLDRQVLVNAYPELTVSGGKGARMRMVWAESPFVGTSYAKGNRNETEGKHIWGFSDEFLPDGGRRRMFTPLWFRAFRYLELTIRTGADPLVLEDARLVRTGYPMRQRARFSDYRRLWDVSWRTARLCAHETFFDCPHYEQMQFPGDTRVQAVYHYLVCGEDRLARKAIDDFHASQQPTGLTNCKWPSKAEQILPTYALYWVGMLEDYRVYRNDPAFLRPYLPGARAALAWFAARIRPDGMLGRVEYAPFYDWAKDFQCGNAPQDADGGSSILSLLLAESCRWMSRLETCCGFPELAPRWEQQAAALVRATLRACWSPERGLLANTSRKETFSVHAQVQAILADAWPAARARRILTRALADATITQPGTFYYGYYVMQAIKRADMRDRFTDLLEPWYRCLEGTGLSTWPEGLTDASRSDCHAWSVSPPIEFIQTVLGVEPDPRADGFGRIRFQPTLGPLPAAQGRAPTPHGMVEVALKRAPDGRTLARIRSPVPVQVPGKTRCLPPGTHALTIESGVET